MKTVGIIAEYNPFHGGHAYHIQEAKRLSGADFVVVILNGDFMQRGEPAMTDKYTRTRQALEGGADLVFELPVRFGISSAGDFALGGILALEALGFVDAVCFGSEVGELPPLLEAAAVLQDEPDAFRQQLTHSLRQGLSFPAARAHALSATTRLDAALLKEPNNILGIEYCCALRKLSSSIKPLTISRKGQAYHDEQETDEALFPSATSLRKKIACEGTQPYLCLNDFSSAIGYALLATETLDSIKDITPELADRIIRFLPDYTDAETFVAQCRNPSLTTGRIRRCLLQCLFGLHNTDPAMPYLRLLGISKKRREDPTLPRTTAGRSCSAHQEISDNSKKRREDPTLSDEKKEASSLLSRRENTSCPILSRLAVDCKNLNPQVKALLQQDLFAADLYRQTWCRKYNVSLPNEYQHSPIVL